jgi:hypothetical protein
MIRPDGTIEIESPRIIITPQFSRKDFLASPLYPVTRPANQNEPYSRFAFDSISLHPGEFFNGSICFKNGLLFDFHAASLRLEFDASRSSSHCDGLRHEHHKKLLLMAFQKQPDERFYWTNSKDEMRVTYHFPWGEVSALIHYKTDDAMIIANYVVPDPTR